MARNGHSRTLARLMAVQALYALDINVTPGGANDNAPTSEELSEAALAFLDEHARGDSPIKLDQAWFRRVLTGVGVRRQELDTMIKTHLDDTWPFARMSPLLLSILRAGVWEMRYGMGITPGIVISEYGLITRSFFDDPDANEPGLVHALLDKIGKVRGDAGTAPTGGEEGE